MATVWLKKKKKKKMVKITEFVVKIRNFSALGNTNQQRKFDNFYTTELEIKLIIPRS